MRRLLFAFFALVYGVACASLVSFPDVPNVTDGGALSDVSNEPMGVDAGVDARLDGGADSMVDAPDSSRASDGGIDASDSSRASDGGVDAPDSSHVSDGGVDASDAPSLRDQATDRAAGKFCETYQPPDGETYACDDFDETTDILNFFNGGAGGFVDGGSFYALESDSAVSPPNALEIAARFLDGGGEQRPSLIYRINAANPSSVTVDCQFHFFDGTGPEATTLGLVLTSSVPDGGSGYAGLNLQLLPGVGNDGGVGQVQIIETDPRPGGLEANKIHSPIDWPEGEWVHLVLTISAAAGGGIYRHAHAQRCPGP